jgi:hypothetical protein
MVYISNGKPHAQLHGMYVSSDQPTNQPANHQSASQQLLAPHSLSPV